MTEGPDDDVRNRYAGMTTNERLFNSGLLDAFNQAVAAKDRRSMIRYLMSTGMTPPDATKTAAIELEAYLQ